MFGQGRPPLFAHISSSYCFIAMLALCAIFARDLSAQAAPTNMASFPVPATDSIRLRITWGGGEARQWTGAISTADGALDSAAPLALTADAPGSVVLSNQKLVISHWSPTNFGGVDLTLHHIANSLTSNSGLQVELSSEEFPDIRLSKTIPISDLLTGTVVHGLDATGNRFSIGRAPGDSLPVRFDRDHLVFSPNEQFEFELSVNRSELVTEKAKCNLQLISKRASVAKPLWSDNIVYKTDENGSANSKSVRLNVPAVEGVYELQIALEAPWQPAAFRAGSLPQRSIQLIVIDETRTIRVTNDWTLVHERSALTPPAEKSVMQLSNFSINNRQAKKRFRPTLENGLSRPTKVSDKSVMELLPSGWQAFPLYFENPGKPHRIDIEYLDAGPAAFGISFLQPDSNGQIPTYGFDAGVLIPNSIINLRQPNSDSAATSRTHQMTCWPNQQHAYLLIANRHATDSALIDRIKIFSSENEAANAEERVPDSRPSRKTRQFMAFYESPMFPEDFTASESTDPAVNQPLDDWQTFYDGATRLVQHLKTNHYRGAFIAVAADGGAIYPSQILGASPKHDSGTFFTNGQDPIRKDVLEMLFRMFKREGLTLVPSLALSAPLPNMELARHSGTNKPTFDLVDYHGSPAARTLTPHLPIYNPLNPQLQQNLIDITAEIAGRYRSHENFEGLALICRPDTYTLLPGRKWGYDSETKTEFLKTLPEWNARSSDPMFDQQQLLVAHQDDWIQWRANQMGAWYLAMLKEVRTAIPTGSLYIAPVDLYRNEEVNSALSPSLHSTIDFRQSMIHMGLDAERFAETEGLCLLKPQRIAAGASLANHRVETSLANHRSLNDYFVSAGSPGSLFTHRASWAQFTQLQAENPFGVQQQPILRHQQLTPADIWNRQRFLDGLRASDERILIDGGWTLSHGSESALRPLRQAFTSLPDQPFRDVPYFESETTGANSRTNEPLQPIKTENNRADLASKMSRNQLPVIVREWSDRNETWFYAVNASPWPVVVRLTLTPNAPESASAIDWLSAETTLDPVLSSRSSSGQPVLQFEMPPFSFRRGKSAATFSIDRYQFSLPDHAADPLRKKIYALQAKLVEATNSRPLNVLDNPGFASPNGQSFSGWDVGQQTSRQIRLHQSASNSNRELTCLHMETGGSQPVWIRSNVMPSPPTGRLTISAWLRTDSPQQQPPLRLAIEAQHHGENFYRFGSVGSLSPNQTSNQLSSQWQRFVVHFDDVPTEQLTDLRIGFDLMGAGMVQIDDVEVFDRWFDEHDAKAVTQRLASCGALLANPETIESCRLLLDGYWLQFLDTWFQNQSGSNRPNAEAVPSNESRIRPTEVADSSASSLDSRLKNSTSSATNPTSDSDLNTVDDGADSNMDSSDPETKPLFRRFRRFNSDRRLNPQ